MYLAENMTHYAFGTPLILLPKKGAGEEKMTLA